MLKPNPCGLPPPIPTLPQAQSGTLLGAPDCGLGLRPACRSACPFPRRCRSTLTEGFRVQTSLLGGKRDPKEPNGFHLHPEGAGRARASCARLRASPALLGCQATRRRGRGGCGFPRSRCWGANPKWCLTRLPSGADDGIPLTLR